MTHFFTYTDAHGSQTGEVYHLKRVKSELSDQCKIWNSYDLQALTDHSGIYYQLVRDFYQIQIALEVIEGAKLIVNSYEQIGDRHFRISLPTEDQANIKGCGLLETSEPATTAIAEDQEIMIHCKQLKLYFPDQATNRVYEFDFTLGRFFTSALNKPAL